MQEKNLKLQALLDGELPSSEAREMERTLKSDAAAAALFAELQTTRTTLKGAELSPSLPESREFYWSKIQRAIQAHEHASDAAATAAGWRILFKRFLAPAVGLAMVVLAGFLALPRQAIQTQGIVTASSGLPAFVYHDDSAGTTLVWLSYPAETDAVASDADYLD